MVVSRVARMSTTLVADIGGSKSRFALANSSGDLEHVLVIENDTVADLDAAVARYLEETGAHPRAATLAVAGSVDGEEVVLTNRTGWRLRRGEFAERFGFSQLRVLNDFEAVAWALPHLGAAHTRPLGTPVEAREGEGRARSRHRSGRGGASARGWPLARDSERRRTCLVRSTGSGRNRDVR